MFDFFVNYRTSDEPFVALLIDQALANEFGPDRVFRDDRSIPLGEHFPPHLWTALQHCRVLIVVIGGRWLDRDSAGNRRIDNRLDYVRREIAEGLRRDILVIPVLVGDTTMPTVDLLPPELTLLPQRQYLQLRLRGAEYDIRRLIDELVELVGPSSLAKAQAKAQVSEQDRAPADGTQITNSFYGTVNAAGSVFGVNKTPDRK